MFGEIEGRTVERSKTRESYHKSKYSSPEGCSENSTTKVHCNSIAQPYSNLLAFVNKHEEIDKVRANLVEDNKIRKICQQE